MNWIEDVSYPLTCETMIRYRQKPQKSVISQQDNNLLVSFQEPQRAITPGQVCAVYSGEKVL